MTCCHVTFSFVQLNVVINWKRSTSDMRSDYPMADWSSCITEHDYPMADWSGCITEHDYPMADWSSCITEHDYPVADWSSCITEHDSLHLRDALLKICICIDLPVLLFLCNRCKQLRNHLHVSCSNVRWVRQVKIINKTVVKVILYEKHGNIIIIYTCQNSKSRFCLFRNKVNTLPSMDVRMWLVTGVSIGITRLIICLWHNHRF